MGTTEMAAALSKLFHDREPRSVAAFERRARAETAFLAVAAGVALLSVVVSLRSLDVLPRGEPATIEEAASLAPTAAPSSAAPQVPLALRALAEPSAPAADRPDDAPLSVRVRPADRAAWRESDFRAEFSALPSSEELSQRAAGAVSGDGPKAEKMAALQVSFERHGGAAAELFVHAATVLPDDSDEHGESVPRAAIHWLGERAVCQPAARSVLEAVALSREVRPELRAASVRALVPTLPEEELPRVAAHFARERDEVVYASAQAALDSRLDGATETTEAQQE